MKNSIQKLIRNDVKISWFFFEWNRLFSRFVTVAIIAHFRETSAYDNGYAFTVRLSFAHATRVRVLDGRFKATIARVIPY